MNTSAKMILVLTIVALLSGGCGITFRWNTFDVGWGNRTKN